MPSTFTDASATGSAIERETDTCAAAWTTTSGRTVSMIAPSSGPRMSTTWRSAPGWAKFRPARIEAVHDRNAVSGGHEAIDDG